MSGHAGSDTDHSDGCHLSKEGEYLGDDEPSHGSHDEQERKHAYEVPNQLDQVHKRGKFRILNNRLGSVGRNRSPVSDSEHGDRRTDGGTADLSPSVGEGGGSRVHRTPPRIRIVCRRAVRVFTACANRGWVNKTPRMDHNPKSRVSFGCPDDEGVSRSERLRALVKQDVARHSDDEQEGIGES